MTLHLLSFKSPETQSFEKQMEANEKLNTIKHIKLENEFNEIQNELNEFKNLEVVYNNKKIYDHFNDTFKNSKL